MFETRSPWLRRFRIVDRGARAALGIAAAIAIATLAGALPSRAAINPKDRRLADVRTGITIEAPAGWTLSRHTGYGDTVVLLLHPDGSRISVSAARTTVRDAAALYEQNRAGLTAQNLLPSANGPGPRGSLAVDLGAAGRPDKIRQLYFVRDVPGGRQALVLTLVGRADGFTTRTPALDFVATRMGWEDPAPTPGSTRTGNGRPSGAGGAAPR
jgi:hypothetical protein